jgi:hypothetical protein
MAGADDIARAELESLRSCGLLRSLDPLRTLPGPEIELRPGERLVNFSSDDYLGLAADPRIAQAGSAARTSYLPGSGLSVASLSPAKLATQAKRARTGRFLVRRETHEPSQPTCARFADAYGGFRPFDDASPWAHPWSANRTWVEFCPGQAPSQAAAMTALAALSARQRGE